MTAEVDPSRKAVVLLSGGLDSATVGAIARAEGYALHALTISYGQRHDIEVEAARQVAESLGVVKHIVQSLDLRAFGGSALTSDVEVPKSSDVSELGDDIPVTYVPARNTIFLSLALGNAEAIGASDIFLGVNAVDYSGYPDCRPVFIEAFEKLAGVATKAGTEGSKFAVHAPLIDLTKAEIIRRGLELGVDYSQTHSCYDPLPDGVACGRCDSCLLRLEGFAQAGVRDSLRYAGA